MQASVEFRNVSKRYGATQVLNSVSLQFKPDVTTAIVGESGSGKSTLLQMANGLVKPDQGAVSVLDSELTENNLISTRLNTGYSVQGAALFPHLTVFENITLMARLQRHPELEIQSRFRELLDLFELDYELSERYPFSLSGGQQQRVSLCRAMMLDPPLVLLDEPFSALDPLTRDTVRQEFINLQQASKRTIVLVTHDMSEAMLLASDIVVLVDGHVEQHAAAQDVLDNPASDYVRNLFSSEQE